MNYYFGKKNSIFILVVLLLTIAGLSYAGLGVYVVEERHWGYLKDNYGEPNPGYGYVAPLIKEVQTSLKNRGYDPGPIDGSWGQETSMALKQYQQDMNLDYTGWIDLKTADMLFGGIKMHFNLTKQVQSALLKKGYDPGSIDGMWGERSKGALKNYQKDHGQFPSGLVDPKLLDLLLKDIDDE